MEQYEMEHIARLRSHLAECTVLLKTKRLRAVPGEMEKLTLKGGISVTEPVEVYLEVAE